jgi:hypothetical protein
MFPLQYSKCKRDKVELRVYKLDSVKTHPWQNPNYCILLAGDDETNGWTLAVFGTGSLFIVFVVLSVYYLW